MWRSIVRGRSRSPGQSVSEVVAFLMQTRPPGGGLRTSDESWGETIGNIFPGVFAPVLAQQANATGVTGPIVGTLQAAHKRASGNLACHLCPGIHLTRTACRTVYGRDAGTISIPSTAAIQKPPGGLGICLETQALTSRGEAKPLVASQMVCVIGITSGANLSFSEPPVRAPHCLF